MLALRERWPEKNVARVARRRRPRRICKSDIMGHSRRPECTQNDGRKGAHAYLSSTDRKPPRSSGLRHLLEEGRALQDSRRAEPPGEWPKTQPRLIGWPAPRREGNMFVKSAQLPGWTRESQQAATCVRHQCTRGRQEKSTAQEKPRKQSQMQSGMVAS